MSLIGTNISNISQAVLAEHASHHFFKLRILSNSSKNKKLRNQQAISLLSLGCFISSIAPKLNTKVYGYLFLALAVYVFGTGVFNKKTISDEPQYQVSGQQNTQEVSK